MGPAIRPRSPPYNTSERAEPSAVTFEEQFLAHLPLLDRVIAFVARRYGLAEAEREEFAAHVRLKCIEDDYRIFREFAERSTIRTYLTSVVQHQFLDYRNAQWGKWRPSTDAVRLGPTAIRLDVLIHRDRLSFDEACGQIISESRGAVSRPELDRLAELLPARVPRRMVGEEAMEALAVDGAAVEAPIKVTENTETRRKAHVSLMKALAGLAAEDRFLLRLRFERNMTVARIAEQTHRAQKPLYRHFERLYARLRQVLEADGVDSEMIGAMLEDPDGPKELVSARGSLRGKED
jgi:RNA polymerase sigma factor (sigma-70 family)